MKKLILTLCFFAGITAAYAQKTVPEIKKGTNMFATVVANGSEIPVLFSVNKIDDTGISVGWSVDGYGDGTFEMTKKGVESGTGFWSGQPNPGATQLADSETFNIISKAAFKSLVDTKSFTYNGTTFTVKATQTPFKMGGKELDTFHVAAPDGREIWILNNPDYPMSVQTTGLGMDMSISEIK